MFHTATYSGDRIADYELVLQQAKSLWEPDLTLTANLANISALLGQFLPRINWAGFYLLDESGAQLVLGPFQGLPACTRIAMGKGVCGTAARTRTTQRVADVHLFPGHIACDNASASEIVVPLIRRRPGSEEQVLGVLDIDSPEKDRFDSIDQEGLEKIVSEIVDLWP